MADINHEREQAPVEHIAPLRLEPDYPQGGAYGNYPGGRQDAYRYGTTPEERVNRGADLIAEDLEKIGQGQEAASLRLLQDLDHLRGTSDLSGVLQQLSQDGFTISHPGKGEHSNFLSIQDKNGRSFKVDWRDGTVNGESKAVQREDAARQAVDFFDNKIGDPRFSEEEIGMRGRELASNLVKAVLDNNQNAISSLSKYILSDPTYLQDCKATLDKLNGPLRIETDASGNSTVTLDGQDRYNSKISFDQNGDMRITRPDGSPQLNDNPESPETTLLRGSNNALKWASDTVERATDVLASEHNLPEDGYVYMPSLIDAYYDRGWNKYF